MPRNKKGFTLIELIAAIMLLGILLTLVTTQVVSQLNKNKRKAVLLSAESYITAINDNNFINDSNKIITSGSVSDINPLVVKQISGDLPDRGTVTVDSETNNVSNATLYIDGYKVTYNGTRYVVTND